MGNDGAQTEIMSACNAATAAGLQCAAPYEPKPNWDSQEAVDLEIMTLIAGSHGNHCNR